MEEPRKLFKRFLPLVQEEVAKIAEFAFLRSKPKVWVYKVPRCTFNVSATCCLFVMKRSATRLAHFSTMESNAARNLLIKLEMDLLGSVSVAMRVLNLSIATSSLFKLQITPTLCGLLPLTKLLLRFWAKPLGI